MKKRVKIPPKTIVVLKSPLTIEEMKSKLTGTNQAKFGRFDVDWDGTHVFNVEAVGCIVDIISDQLLLWGFNDAGYIESIETNLAITERGRLSSFMFDCHYADSSIEYYNFVCTPSNTTAYCADSRLEVNGIADFSSPSDLAMYVFGCIINKLSELRKGVES